MPERLGASVDLEGSHVPYLSFFRKRSKCEGTCSAPPIFLHSLFGQTLPLDAGFLNFLSILAERNANATATARATPRRASRQISSHRATMSHTWFVRLPPQLDDHSRIDDAALLAGLRGGVVAEKPITVVAEQRLDCARPDPNDHNHACAVERRGVFRSMRVGGRDGSGIERFQLHTESDDGELKPVSRSWRQFEFIPRQEGAFIFTQTGSPNLLFSTIPTKGSKTGSMVFLFGSCSAAVNSFAIDANGSVVVAGAQDGSLAVWKISDGKKVGAISGAHEGGVRAVTFLSPTCVVSAGADGTVRIWHVSGDPRLRMLHRMAAGDSPLTAIAAWAQEGVAHQFLAAGADDGTVYAWKAKAPVNVDGEMRWEPTTVSHHLQGKEVVELSFRGDGAALIAGACDERQLGAGEVRLFETEHWTLVASQPYSSHVVACMYSRSKLIVDLVLVCSAAGSPRLFEGRLVPAVSAPLRDRGLGSDMPPQPLGHGLPGPLTNRDGDGIRIVRSTDSDDENDPRDHPPPIPAKKMMDPTPEAPKPVLRPAFRRSGKYHAEPRATPAERATRLVAQMAADAMANAPVISDDDHDDDVENQGDPYDGLVGVEGAETILAKPTLMSSRPILHRSALIPFAVFDRDTELQHHMAPLGISGREEAAKVADTHVRAMAAANMNLAFPRNGRRFEGLAQIPKASVPTKAKRMVGKQLDPRWLAVRDIKPRMEDMWVAARREPQVCSTEGCSSSLLMPPSKGVEY